MTSPNTNAALNAAPDTPAISVAKLLSEQHDNVQFIATDTDRMTADQFEFRSLTLDDITDDCPVCTANREKILAGEPPLAYIQKPAVD